VAAAAGAGAGAGSGEVGHSGDRVSAASIRKSKSAGSTSAMVADSASHGYAPRHDEKAYPCSRRSPHPPPPPAPINQMLDIAALRCLLTLPLPCACVRLLRRTSRPVQPPPVPKPATSGSAAGAAAAPSAAAAAAASAVSPPDAAVVRGGAGIAMKGAGAATPGPSASTPASSGTPLAVASLAHTVWAHSTRIMEAQGGPESARCRMALMVVIVVGLLDGMHVCCVESSHPLPPCGSPFLQGPPPRLLHPLRLQVPPVVVAAVDPAVVWCHPRGAVPWPSL
jgi:hypothetical protein